MIAPLGLAFIIHTSIIIGVNTGKLTVKTFFNVEKVTRVAVRSLQFSLR